MGSLTFSPTVDPADSEEEIFISQTPYEILSSGIFYKVPIMLGFTDNEALSYVAPGVVGQPEVDDVNANNHLFIPHTWNVEHDSVAQDEIVEILRDYYLDGLEVSLERRNDLAWLATDQQFSFPIDLAVRFHATQQEEEIYYYTFSMDGSLNFIKLLSDVLEYPGAAHADDLFYIWDISEMANVEIPDGDPAGTVRDRMVRVYTNFAKYSNPTPTDDALIGSIWVPVSGNQEFMELNVEFTPGTHTFAPRIELWQNLFDTYATPSFTRKL